MASSFYLKNYHGFFLQNHDNVITQSPNHGEWEHILIQKAPRNSKYPGVTITNRQTKPVRYFSARLENTVSLWGHNGETEYWTIVPHPTEAGKVAFRSSHNTYICAQPDGRLTLAPHMAEWEAWKRFPIVGPWRSFLAPIHMVSENPPIGTCLVGRNGTIAIEPRPFPNNNDPEWTTIHVDLERVTLQDPQGLYLSTDEDGIIVKTTPNQTIYSLWTIDIHPFIFSLTFKTVHGTYLCAQPNYTITLSPNVAEWESWNLYPNRLMPLPPLPEGEE